MAICAAAIVPAAGAATFTNTGSITIDDNTVASVYPSTIAVAGQFGNITDVDVKVENLGHEHPDDLDILLVSPSGDRTVLMSDACGFPDVEDVDWTWDDEATAAMPDSSVDVCPSGSYKPGVYETDSDTWPTEFPGPHGETLARFDGENPLGTWRLFVRDDAAGDVGDIEGGWSLTITTGPHAIAIPGSTAIGPGAPYPSTVAIAGRDPVVTDVNVVLNGLSHTNPDDLDILAQGPEGQTVMLMSDACGSFDLANYFWRWDDEATLVMADSGSTNVCSGFNHLPTDYQTGDSLPFGAPAGPYGTSLAVFDGTNPNGTWRVFASDDTDSDAGFLVNAPVFEIATRPGRLTSFATATLDQAEGGSASIVVQRASAGLNGEVRLRTVAGSATLGDDFGAVDQVLDFAAGETVKQVAVPIVDDTVTEGAEQFTVELLDPEDDVALGAPGSATITIPANDPQPPQPPAPPAPPAGAPAGGTALSQSVQPPNSTTTIVALTAANTFTLPATRRCRRRGPRLKLTPREPRGVQFSRTEVRVNGKRQALRTGAKADDPVALRVRGNVMKVRIKITTADGRTLTIRRTYRVCRAAKKSKK